MAFEDPQGATVSMNGVKARARRHEGMNEQLSRDAHNQISAGHPAGSTAAGDERCSAGRQVRV
jgi:hypothetical protein